MKSTIFTRLIQGMDEFDNTLCNSEEAQIKFIESFLISLNILKSHTHILGNTMTLQQLYDYHSSEAKSRVAFIGKSLDILKNMPLSDLVLDTYQIDKENVTWAIGTLRTK